MGEKDTYFYSVENDNVHKIKVDDINELAAFALTMEPLPAESEALGYVSALATYFKLNPDSEYKKIYDEITSSMEGGLFLVNTVDIACIQRRISLRGASENNKEALQRSLDEYRKALDYSQSMVDSNGAVVPGKII